MSDKYLRTKPFDSAAFADEAVEGLGAIAETRYRSRIRINVGTTHGASVFSVAIDAAMRSAYPNEHRWDYGVWYGSGAPKLAFIEVHKAESGEVNLVLRKQAWLKRILVPARLPAPRWYWLATGKDMIPKQSRYYRSLVAAGIVLASGDVRLD